jgi:hypothetical protein
MLGMGMMRFFAIAYRRTPLQAIFATATRDWSSTVFLVRARRPP